MYTFRRGGDTNIQPIRAGLTDFAVELPSGLFLEELYMIVCLSLSSRTGYSLEEPVSFWPVGKRQHSEN